MKIESNVIGNYGPAVNKNLISNSLPQGSLTDNVKKDAKLSVDEKKFFAGLYPENVKEVMDYHFYEKSGKLSGVTLGSMFDRKG
jgi:hypothetical protein